MEIPIVILSFVISMVVSAIIIYIVTKLLGQEEGLGSAVMAAFVGAIVYTGAYFFLGTGLLAAFIGGIVWLIALGSIYKIGWLKALLIAVIVWIAVSILSFLPTVIGPL
ncbi:MAG: hypothetical protein JW716_05270 [Candidatus Aenigmarchaeota archaeon]|nr:hypothetical protein [Candidatus Aenigmarchaeota archaeon]